MINETCVQQYTNSTQVQGKDYYMHQNGLMLLAKVHNSESNIDALCVGPCFATLTEDFFVVLHSMFTSRPEVSEVHCITDAEVPLMRFKLDGISIDLPYAQLKVMSVPEVSVMHVEPNLSKQFVSTVVSVYTQGSHNVDILNTFFLSDIDETSWRSLSGVHANKCILRHLLSMEISSMLSMGSYGNQYQPILCRSSFDRNLSDGFSRDAERAESIWTPR
ncbi:Nuclear poly(A) polymerase 3 [Camellia lanceoleosa]|uniref:Nuclear poly(A) polymerase 3 n=1 Tax=Camellia lanceoleosa TaxID=1840588 RepID=A0ACC0GVY9_9ERIC|nr:Nuclear poly(A) polymerase 3 [Camellia lanceoleosa]